MGILLASAAMTSKVYLPGGIFVKFAFVLFLKKVHVVSSPTSLYKYEVAFAEAKFKATKSRLTVDSSYFNFRSEEHTSELQSRENLVCRLLLEKKKSL